MKNAQIPPSPRAMLVTLAGRVAVTPPTGSPAKRGLAQASPEGINLGPRGRLAFAYLVCQRHRPVPRDELAEVLWGDDLPQSWPTAVRGLNARIRAWLATSGGGPEATVISELGLLELRLPAGAVVDVEEAAAAVGLAAKALGQGDAEAARSLAGAALAVTGQDFVPGGTGWWVERQQAELRDLHLRALEVRSEASSALRDWGAALVDAEEAVSRDPLRESAHIREIAAHAGAGNRGAALRAYERCRSRLAEELGVSPSPETEASYLALLGTEPAPAQPAGPPPPSGSPWLRRRVAQPASSFVGREAEVAELRARLAGGRLVTVTGPGGIGKTRLALQVADRISTPAVVVELAPVTGGVAGQLLAALPRSALPPFEAGDSDADRATAALAGAEVLVVLDNCEHVVEEAAMLVDAVLRACPGARVLATSREPLGVAGEVTWAAPPLAVPPVGAVDLGTVASTDAARLFLERAAAATAGFQPAPEDAPALARICRRLDGLPLALELAAARAGTLSINEIESLLDDRFRLLRGGPRTAPARHQALRATIDWSYDSLDPAGAALLRQLSLFPGPFTLSAAARVAGHDRGDVLDRLSGLVARSLVIADVGRPGTRYRLLESLRAYAWEKLEQAGEAEAGQARLLGWAASLAEQAEQHLDGPEQARWLDRLDADHDNLRGALAAGPSAPAALRLATSLARFWELRGHFDEGRERLRQVLDAARTDPAGPPDDLSVRARALNAAGLLALRQGDWGAARSRLGEALAIRRRLGDRLGVAIALHGLGNVAALQHELPTARTLYEESLAIGQEEGEPNLVAASLANLGWVAHAGADLEHAQSFYERALGMREELGDPHGQADVLGHLANLAFQQGDLGAAAGYAARSLALREEQGDRPGVAAALATVGHLALAGGEVARARAHLDRSLAISRDLGDNAALPGALCNLADLDLVCGDLDTARAHLDEAAAVALASRDRRSRAHVLLHVARVARAGGDPALAATAYHQAKQALGTIAEDGLGAEWLEGMGATMAAAGDPARGARLLAAAAALRERIGVPVPPTEAAAYAHDLAGLRAVLGEAAFATGWASGRALGFDAALAEAGTNPVSPGREGGSGRPVPPDLSSG